LLQQGTAARGLFRFCFPNDEERKQKRRIGISAFFLLALCRFLNQQENPLISLGGLGGFGFSVSWFLSEAFTLKTFIPSRCVTCNAMFQPVDWMQCRVDGYCCDECVPKPKEEPITEEVADEQQETLSLF
jgi:nitrate reductase NapE component